MSRDLVVVIPTWDCARALTRIKSLRELEAGKRVEYVVVVPEVETGKEAPIATYIRWAQAGQPEVCWITTNTYLSPVEAMAGAGDYLMKLTSDSAHRYFLFLHDDVEITEVAWDRRVVESFLAHPQCGLLGFGGGTTFAHPDIYKVPYDHRQLGRGNFVSNMREAEVHGTRVTEPVRVAALDGFALATTRELYYRAGDRYDIQWMPPTTPGVERQQETSNGAWNACLNDGLPYHMYDAWISCRAAELGYETWMIPIQCHHEGGQTSVKREKEYNEVVRRLGYSSAQELYDDGHRKIYERFRGLLPLKGFS